MNTRKALLAGTTMLLLLAATLALSPAMAQENDTEKKVRPDKKPDKRALKNGTFVTGFGAAVEDDEAYRSHMRLALAKSDAASNNYEVKKGLVVINDKHSPVRYEVIPDTWTIEVREDNSAFSAKGQVQDQEGDTYDVSLAGDLLHQMSNGKLYSIKGTFSGNGEDYALYYFAVVRDNTNQAKESGVTAEQ